MQYVYNKKNIHVLKGLSLIFIFNLSSIFSNYEQCFNRKNTRQTLLHLMVLLNMFSIGTFDFVSFKILSRFDFEIKIKLYCLVSCPEFTSCSFRVKKYSKVNDSMQSNFLLQIALTTFKNTAKFVCLNPCILTYLLQCLHNKNIQTCMF